MTDPTPEIEVTQEEVEAVAKAIWLAMTDEDELPSDCGGKQSIFDGARAAISAFARHRSTQAEQIRERAAQIAETTNRFEDNGEVSAVATLFGQRIAQSIRSMSVSP